MHRFEWHDEQGAVDAIEFRLGHGDTIRLLRRCGFEIEDLLEVQAPATDMSTRGRHSLGVGAAMAERRGLEGAQALFGATHSLGPPFSPRTRRGDASQFPR
jgi:hypothetical protein